MAQNLRLHGQRNRLVMFVGVVVGVAGEDVRVSAAESDRGRSHEHFVRRNDRTRNVAHFHTADVEEDTRFHDRSLVSSRPASRSSAKRRIVARIPSRYGVDGNDPIARLIAASSIAGAIGIGGPLNVISSSAASMLMNCAICSVANVSPCRLKTCAPAGALSAQAI